MEENNTGNFSEQGEENKTSSEFVTNNTTNKSSQRPNIAKGFGKGLFFVIKGIGKIFYFIVKKTLWFIWQMIKEFMGVFKF